MKKSDRIIYDEKLFSSVEYAKQVSFIEQKFRSRSKRVRKVIDVGCGTGINSKILHDRGYQVVGVDIDGSRIDLARKRWKNISFSVGDMRDLKMDSKFDAAVCLFNVIYFNSTLLDLSKTFSRLYSTLNDGGVLFFDINTRLLKDNFTKTNHSLIGHNENNLIIARFGSTVQGKDLLKTKLTYLVKNKGAFLCYTAYLKFGFFSIKEIEKAMMNAGFIKIEHGISNNFRIGATYFMGEKYESNNRDKNGESIIR